MLVPLTNVSALAFIFCLYYGQFLLLQNAALQNLIFPDIIKYQAGKIWHLTGLSCRITDRTSDGSSRKPRYTKCRRMEYRFGMAGYRPDYQNFAPK